MTGNCTAVVLNNIRGASISSDGRNVEWRKGGDLGGFWGALGVGGTLHQNSCHRLGPRFVSHPFPPLERSVPC